MIWRLQRAPCHGDSTDTERDATFPNFKKTSVSLLPARNDTIKYHGSMMALEWRPNQADKNPANLLAHNPHATPQTSLHARVHTVFLKYASVLFFSP